MDEHRYNYAVSRLVEIIYKNIKKKARHKASTKISELKDEPLWKPFRYLASSQVRAAHQGEA